MSEENPMHTREALQQIQRARDTARLRLHLLSADAKVRWHELEASLASLEQKVAKGDGKVTGVLLGRLRELTGGVTELLQVGAASLGGLRTPMRELMTQKVRTCSPEDSLASAARVMWEADCGAVPVVGADGKLAGVITDRDIAMAAYTRGIRLDDATVESTMCRGAHACLPDDSVEFVLDLMAVHKIRRVPVTTDAGHLLGIVTLADIARHVRRVDGASDGISASLGRALSDICEPRASAPRRAAAE